MTFAARNRGIEQCSTGAEASAWWRMACVGAILLMWLGAKTDVTAASSCDLAVRLDCVTTATNTAKRGFAPLIADFQNPTVYLKKVTSFSASHRRDGQDCFSCHHQSTTSVSDTWEFTAAALLPPTNSAWSGATSYHTETNGVVKRDCSSVRTSPTNWSDPACVFTNVFPTTVVVSNLAASSYLLILTNFAITTNGSRIETNYEHTTTSIDLYFPTSLEAFFVDATNTLASIPFPHWTNATRYGSAEKGGTNTANGDYMDFSARVSRFKYRIAFLGAKDQKETITWYEVFTPYGGGPVTNNVFTNEVICTGLEQFVTFPDGTTERIVGPPSTQGKMEVFLESQWGCNTRTCTSPGAGEGATGSIDVKIGLGKSDTGEPAGFLFIHEETPKENLATPVWLRAYANHGTLVISNAGAIRQVKSPQTLADIVTINTSKYEIRFYSSAGAFTSGLYQTDGSPFSVWTIERPGTTNTFRVTQTGGASPVVYDYVYSAASGGWTLVAGGTRQESRTTTIANGYRTETFTISETNGTLVYKEVNAWRQTGLPLGDLLVTNKVGPDASPAITRWSYYTNSATDGPAYGKMKEVVRPNGGWEQYYYTNYRLAKVVSVFTNSTVGSPDNQNRVTIYGYSPVDASDNGLTETNTPRTTIEYLLGNEVGRQYTIFAPGQRLDIQCQTPGAQANTSGNLTNVTKKYSVAGYDGIVSSHRSPDGTMQFTYAPTPREGVWLTNIVLSGQPDTSGTTIVDGTQATTIVNNNGQVVLEQTVAIPSGLVISQQTYGYTDTYSGPTSITNLDGTVAYSSYDCCGLQSTTDRDGVTTTYGYDALHRPIWTSRSGITTSNILDAAGNARSIFRIGTDGTVLYQGGTTYDAAGNLTSSADPQTNITSFSTKFLTTGVSNYTVYPDNGTRIEIYAADGSLLQVAGTAVHPSRYEYGVENESGIPRSYAKEIKLDRNGADTPQWTKTYSDFAGRTYKTVYPDSAAQVSYFNERGQLSRVVDPDGVTNSFGYNSKGQLEYTTNGPDRVVRSFNSYVANAAGFNVLRTETFELDESNSFISTAAIETSTDGLWSRTVRFGRTNETQTVYGTGGTRTLTSTSPDGSKTVQTYQNGRLVSMVTSNAQSAILKSVSFGYDPHGRRTTIGDVRVGTSTLTFNNADNVTGYTAPPALPGQAPQQTSYSYDPLGRASKVVMPDSGSISNTFTLAGEVQTNSGARTYPISYGYDSQGRMTNLTTWQNWPSGGTANTRWTYDPQRGFLLSKTYQATNGPSYTYTLAGRLKSRAWARGVTNSFTYNAYGDLFTITYSDGTPGITNFYDRRGRATNIWQGTNLTVFAYNNGSQLASEAKNGIVVSNAYDSILRWIELSLSGPSASLSQRFGYEGASRLQSVTNGTATVTYGYLPNSAFIQGITFRNNGSQRLYSRSTYDNLNRLQERAYAPSAGPSFVFDYGYNLANQRTNLTLADGSKWTYAYDSLGQLNSGKRYWADGIPVAGQQFEYFYDTIGNRTVARSGGNNSGSPILLRGFTYGGNLLNQYTSRNVRQNDLPGESLASAIDVLGAATTGWSLSVSWETNIDRHGDYWHATLRTSNGNNAAYLTLTNRAVSGSTTNIKAGDVFVYPMQESFSYDADGNILQDGRWNYVWNGENQLVGIYSRTNTPTASWVSSTMAYDFMGRRTSKVISNWTGSAWVKTNEYRYVYSGWNLLAILDASNALQYSFTWGLDLSQSRDGAGGIGGLLAMTVHSGSLAGTYFYCFDGSGNVVGLVNATNGTVAGQYEYGPFGEVIRASGPLARSNPFRFSTKFQDEETGLSYYGYRYYDSRLGRWLGKDPLAEVEQPNLYGFVLNNPSGVADTDGRQVFLMIESQLIPRPGIAGEFYAPRGGGLMEEVAPRIGNIADTVGKAAETGGRGSPRPAPPETPTGGGPKPPKPEIPKLYPPLPVQDPVPNPKPSPDPKPPKPPSTAKEEGCGNWHHVATDKNSKAPKGGGPWTPRFQPIFDNAGITFNDDANLVYVVNHKGLFGHPPLYHQIVFNALTAAVKDKTPYTQGYTDALRAVLRDLGQQCATPGTLLNSLITK